MVRCHRVVALLAVLSVPTGMIGTAAVTASQTGTPMPDEGTPPATPAMVPQTPVGQQLEWFLLQLNGDAATLTAADVEQHFAASFLAAVPADQVVAITRQLATQMQPVTLIGFEGTPTENEAVALVSAKDGGRFRILISVEAAEPHLIAGLLVQPAPLPLESWEELDRQLAELAPDANFLAAELVDGQCQTVHAVNPAQRLAIGSTFKLYILGELAHQIDEGNASWDEELAVRDDWKSLPSGLMQDEPAGTTHTLRYFAEQMISISDNTATDHLLFHLGRENVEAFQARMGHSDPTANMPFLATRELFVLKLALPPERAEAYAEASVEERRQLLATEIAQTEVTVEDAKSWTTPRWIDSLEWFASADDLCRAMAALNAMSERPGLEPLRDILAINPGISFEPATWTYVGFKGGSELGVLNLTWLLQRADGRWFVLTVGLNDTANAIDEPAVTSKMQSVASFLGQSA
jgi:beta-lactamase class A